MALSLDLSLAYVPATISELLLGDVSRSKNGSHQKMVLLEDFVKRLEDEMRKIEAFKRELPLCMLLVKDAITRLKEETDQCMRIKDKPVVEEFMPLKTNSEGEKGSLIIGKESCEKKNWMSSVQLWSAQTKSRSEEGDRSVPENPIQPKNDKNNTRGPIRAFNFGNSCVSSKEVVMKDENNNKEVSHVPSLSLMTPTIEQSHGNSKSGIGGSFGSSLLASTVEVRGQLLSQQHQNPRKQRRCWSPELHRRFVDALEQLGGPQVATPKQIREMMQVGGLTNDEVKSHLQKYRLHIRRLPVSSTGQENGNLWMSQDQKSGDKSKGSLSKSGSPQGPLFLRGSTNKGLSSSGRNKNDAEEEEEDERSDCRSWKGGLHQQPEADEL